MDEVGEESPPLLISILLKLFMKSWILTVALLRFPFLIGRSLSERRFIFLSSISRDCSFYGDSFSLSYMTNGSTGM
jgi:hypothetical protein